MNTIHDDLIERSVDVHWPTGFASESADLFAHNTIVIAASAESMWAKLTTLPPGPPGIPTPSDVFVDDSSGRLGKPWPRSLEHQPQVRLRES
jgi:hypothetical protein